MKLRIPITTIATMLTALAALPAGALAGDIVDLRSATPSCLARGTCGEVEIPDEFKRPPQQAARVQAPGEISLCAPPRRMTTDGCR